MANLGFKLPSFSEHSVCSPQPCVSAYLDAGIYQREMELVFQHGPRYLGHALAVPHKGDYYALPHENEGRALLHTAQGIELISNVCRHRQATMLRGRGHTGANIVCPLHRWTYDLQGKLIGAPHFQEDPCLHLKTYPTKQWNGLVFEDNGRNLVQELAPLKSHADLNFTGYVLNNVHIHQCDYNWKTFMEVYLEDYHVGPFHPGLNQFVNCTDLRWEFGQHYSLQTVGANKALHLAVSPVYQRWHNEVLKFRAGSAPQKGAIWLSYYPQVMVEWYPHVLVVSTLHPNGPQSTTNVVEFFYPEEIAAFEPEFVLAHQAAYLETCAEDDEIALRMDAGRKALFDRGDNEVGPYQSPMEDGMAEFHTWYQQAMQLRV
jgi:choline monooxygenase